MYEKDELAAFLSSRNYTQVFCEQEWIPHVKEAYRAVLQENPSATLIDMRCPKAVSLAKKNCNDSSVIYPEIEPILIHCARELSRRYGKESRVLITTPCKSLAEYGNSLKLLNTSFISWNDFAKSQKCTLQKKHLSESPIPPGFFREIEKDSLSVTGKDSISNLFISNSHKSFRLVEMLFCKEGCNNGDGVL